MIDTSACFMELGLEGLRFSKAPDAYYDFATPYYDQDGSFYEDDGHNRIRAEVRFRELLDGTIRTCVSHSNNSGTVNWMFIEGSLAERREKILEYLVDYGFNHAIPFLREYKIDSLIIK